MTYTREGILFQIYVAFGQGTGTMRVSQEACMVLSERYGARIDDEVLATWSTIGVQVLERMRAIGRAAAAEAALAGSTALTADLVEKAAIRVESVSRTVLCPPTLTAGQEPRRGRAKRRPQPAGEPTALPS